MKIPWGLIPMTAHIARSHNSRVKDFEEGRTGLSDVVAELAEQVDDVVGVLSKLELRLGLAEGAIQVVQEDGVIYFKSLANPDLGLIEVDTEMLVVDADGNIGLRY